jgi:hypothetical protein
MSTTKIFKLAVSVILFWNTFAVAQHLTISSTGQTGTSGANWTTSGTNPITLTASGGTVDILI